MSNNLIEEDRADLSFLYIFVLLLNCRNVETVTHYPSNDLNKI